MVSGSDKKDVGKFGNAEKYALFHNGQAGQIKNSWNDRWGNRWHHIEHHDGTTGKYREDNIKTIRDNGRFTQMEMDAQRKIYEDIEKKREEFQRKEDAKRNEIEKERDKNASKTNAATTTASMAAPEASPIIGAIAKWKNDRDNRKAQKREERLEEKHAGDESSLMKKQKDLMEKQYRNQKSGGGDENHAAIVLLFLFAIMAHILDWLSGFTRPPTVAVLAFWIVIIVAHFFFVSDKHFDSDQNTLIGVMALVVILPMIVNYLFSTITNAFIIKVGVVLVAFPPLVLYLMFKFPAGAQFGKWYLYAWTILITIMLITSPAAQEALGDSTEQFTKAQAALSVKTFAETAKKSVNKFIAGVSGAFDRAVAQATGQEYEGDEESRVGIFLEDVHPIEQQFYTSSEVYLQGTIRAKNIKETVIIKTRCYVPDTNITGITYPETINMVNDDENYIDCKFPGHFAPGAFEVRMAAQFLFTTEAKINYYFIDASRRPESYVKTDIPKKTVAIYTGGPVVLGLPSLNQPLRISTDMDNREVGDYPFGISLKNKWSEGEIVRGLNYTLDVPDSVTLYTCNRDWSEGSPKESEGRKIYTFYIDNNNLKESFDSVTCRMRVNSPSEVLGSDIERAPEVTFRGTATYEYAVEATSYVNVVADGTG